MKSLLIWTAAVLACVCAFLLGRSIRDPSVNTEDKGSVETQAQNLGTDPLDSVEQPLSGNEDEIRELYDRLADLQRELDLQRKSSARVQSRYDMLMESRRGPREFGFSSRSNGLLKISEETYEFLQLEPEKEKRLREISDAIWDELIAWEQLNVRNIRQKDNSISVDLPAMTDKERERRNQYRDTMKEMLGEADFKFIDESMTNVFRNNYFDRSIRIEESQRGDRTVYLIETSHFDENGGSRGSGRSSSSQFPERYRHLFGE